MDAQGELAEFLDACLRDAQQDGKLDWRDIRDFVDRRIANLPDERRSVIGNLLKMMADPGTFVFNTERLH